MVTITELEISRVDITERIACYTEGPDLFDRWYSLVKQKYPNVWLVRCARNGLKKINCDARSISCYGNPLEYIIAPNATSIFCRVGEIPRVIIAPKLRLLQTKNGEIRYPDDSPGFR